MQLDEVNGPVMEEGLDTKVIATKVKAKTGFGSLLFEIAIWCAIPLIGIILAIFVNVILGVIIAILGLIPGIVLQVKETKLRNYFDQLQQKLQQDRSTIDNYLEQRVVILRNTAKLVETAVKLDEDTYSKIAALRSGGSINASNDLTQKQAVIDNAYKAINVSLEKYPDLKAHEEINKAMEQNSYLQKEITAAREVYNDRVALWNKEIFEWPLKNIVAARCKYETIIPFTASKEIKDAARGVFF